ASWGVRFKLEWPPRAVVIAAHLAAAAATLLLFVTLGTMVNHWFGVDAPGPFWIHFRNACVYQLPFAVVTYSATVGSGYVAEYTRRSRELAKLQAELTQAQLSALRMQLNPHFLFNTLHTIAVFVREHDERHAVEMIEQLGDVLRHVLRSSNELEVPLAGEVSFLQKYLEIEQARFGDRLQVVFAIDDAAGHAMVPQLIVQPLVENALRHGLAPRAAAGRLSVTGTRRGDVLELEVRDDGLGLRAGWDDDEGLGLPNVRDRLARMYGPAGRLVLVSPPGGGVIATITMPFRRGSDA
ncbi:MAG: histidine kinase, partial [Kofleriaceae bacterium]